MQIWGKLTIAIVSYLLGIVTGYYGCEIVGSKLRINGGIDYRNFVIIIISIGWIASVLVEIINPAYATNPLIHGLMGGIVGYFFKQKQNE